MSPATGERPSIELSCWLCEAYGAPCPRTSEVSRCAGYYSVEALVVFGTCICPAR